MRRARAAACDLLPTAAAREGLAAAAPSPRALSPGERGVVLALLHEPRFVDLAPAEVYATLLDAGQYVCSERTMYRLLAEHAEVRERRDQLRHPVYAAPELLARRPNELWSWDITKLLGPAKWTYFYLYVMLDVFSRYVVGWMVAHRESATLAQKFIGETCARQGIDRGQLTIHADRGARDDLETGGALTRRPRRDEDPRPAACLQRQPVLGGAVQDAEVPAGLPGAVRRDPGCPRPLPHLLPLVQRRTPSQRPGPAHPHDVHFGLAEQRVAARATVLAAAYAAHPERFPRGLPQPPGVPHGSLDQRTQHAWPLARSIEDPALRLAHEGTFA